MVRTLRKNDYMTVLKQKCSCLPHRFIIFRQWETQHMDKLAYKHDWQKIHSVSQRSFIWSFKIVRIETQQINQFPQPNISIAYRSNYPSVMYTFEKIGLSGCKPWNQRKSRSCMSLHDKVITQELNKIAALSQRSRLKIAFS